MKREYAMTVEIHEPELEQLLRQRIDSGQNLEKVLLDALRRPQVDGMTGLPERSLSEVFAMARGLADDLDFSRNPSTAREIDFE